MDTLIAHGYLEAFKLLGGTVREREADRYEITNVPAPIRSRDRAIGRGEPVLQRYERVTFEKKLIAVPGKPLAAFVCPGHPLLDAVIDLILERHRDLLRRGAILIDADDPSEEPRALVYIEHSIQDARTDRGGSRYVISREMQFVEINTKDEVRQGGYAPYLDYRPMTANEAGLLSGMADQSWLKDDLEKKAMGYAVAHLVPQHYEEVRSRREQIIERSIIAVKDRLTKEITYWDHRAETLKEQELAGRGSSRLNSGNARQRADDLTRRLQDRMSKLEQERHISPMPPVVLGGALIVPMGLVAKMQGQPLPAMFARETERVEKLAMDAVMRTENKLGFIPRDVSAQKLGWDIESSIPGTGKLRFIEVKGRAKGAATVTVTSNEIRTGLNKPEDFILALVEVSIDAAPPRYVRNPFEHEPDFAAVSVNFKLNELLARSEEPK